MEDFEIRHHLQHGDYVLNKVLPEFGLIPTYLGLLPTQSCEERVELQNEEVVVYQTVQDHFLPPPPSIDNDGEDDVKEETFVDDLAWLESID